MTLMRCLYIDMDSSFVSVGQRPAPCLRRWPVLHFGPEVGTWNFCQTRYKML